MTKNGTIPGGQNLPNNGVVYLQPDPTLRSVPKTTDIALPQINGGYQSTSYPTGGHYQKGLLTDEPAGFNAYFLTDTPTLSSQTKNAYFAVRGSDGGFDIGDQSNWNDWIDNNLPFTIKDANVPQAKLATDAMKAKFDEMRQKAPQAKMNFTGHSLGTFVTAQGLAGLDPKYWDQIGNVVLFNGPDPTKSLQKMGLSDAQIKQLGSHVTYYLNPLDVVSMLNREVPVSQQFGKVHFIVPLDITDSFTGNGSAHMFGQFQFDKDGNPKIASSTYHPYLLEAGEKIAKLLAEAKKNKLRAVRDWKELQGEYDEIIAWARSEAIKWNKQAIPDYQSKIRGASESDKVSLRMDLLQAVAQLMVLEVGDQLTAIEEAVAQSKTDTKNAVTAAETQARMVGHRLPYWEIENLLVGYSFNDIWSSSKEDAVLKTVKTYREKVNTIAEKLLQSARNFEDIDSKGVELFS
ncbi:TPA: cutinase family protein [Streptococcus suis]|nr:DUF2974 domain-containing protein [Streptococcus suis]